MFYGVRVVSAAIPYYNVMRKPVMASKSMPTKTLISHPDNEVQMHLDDYTTTFCDELLVFTDRSDIGGVGANDKGTEHEDRAMIDLDEDGARSIFSFGANGSWYRKFDVEVTDDNNADGTAAAKLSVKVKGSARFYKVDTSNMNNFTGSVSITEGRATFTASAAHGLTSSDEGEYVLISGLNNTPSFSTPIVTVLSSTKFVFTTTEANGSDNVTATIGTTEEGPRELLIKGASRGALVSAQALSTLSGSANGASIWRLESSSTSQPMDVNNISTTIAAASVSGADSTQHSNRRFPAASGILDEKITDESLITLNLIEAATAGTHNLVTCEGGAANVEVTVDSNGSIASFAKKNANALVTNLRVGLNYRLGNSTGPLVHVNRKLTAIRVLPDSADIAIAKAGTGYSVGDIVWIQNPNEPLGKDVLEARVTSVANGGITGVTYTHKSGAAPSSAKEPVYEINENLPTCTVIGSGSGAEFKVTQKQTQQQGAPEQPPTFEVASDQIHPFYIYTETENKVALQVMQQLSMMIEDASAKSITNRPMNAWTTAASGTPSVNGNSISLAKQTTTLTSGCAADATTIDVADATMFAVGSELLIGDELMQVTAINGNRLTVLRGEEVEVDVAEQNRPTKAIHSSEATVTLLTDNLFTQGSNRILFTDNTHDQTTTDVKNRNKVTVARVDPNAAVAVGKTYTVDVNPALRNHFRAEGDTNTQLLDRTRVTHIVWNVDTTQIELAQSTFDKKFELPTVMGRVLRVDTVVSGGATKDRYTVELQSTSDGKIYTGTDSQGTILYTRATLLSVETFGTAIVSKPFHMTPMSREVHLSGLQLKTVSRMLYGSAQTFSATDIQRITRNGNTSRITLTSAKTLNIAQGTLVVMGSGRVTLTNNVNGKQHHYI